MWPGGMAVHRNGDLYVAYGRYLDLRSDVVFGGVSPNPQINRLRHGTDVLVATPGRLMDLVGGEDDHRVRFKY